MTNHETSVLFFLQMAFILATIRLVGFLAKKIGQPQVVGEMIAGVLMGPSLLGYLFPELHTNLFPQQSITLIYAVSQIGLVIYMFLIGVEFNTALIRTRIRSATLVSVAGIITPFILGGLLILLFLQNAPLFAPEVTVWQAMLFTGAAMSITAFPMLARIIYERGLSGSSLGTLVLAAGSLDDAAAWSLMAIVLASFSGSAMIAISAIGGGLLYGLIVLFGLRRLLRPLETAAQQQQHLSGSSLSLILILLMLAAWFTDFVGIYAVFGAFILGVAMPRGIVSRDLRHLLEPLTTYFLVPLFFIYSGLNTHLNLLVSPGLWGIVVLVVITAVVGKGLACWAAARLSGENNREAMAVGVLMNARGMMELILLNIGLEKGLITETFFTIMVIMAIVTTLITSPLFEWVYGRKMKLAAAVPL